MKVRWSEFKYKALKYFRRNICNFHPNLIREVVIKLHGSFIKNAVQNKLQILNILFFLDQYMYQSLHKYDPSAMQHRINVQ